MIRSIGHFERRAASRQGLSLVEVLAATLILGGLTVVALEGMGQLRTGQLDSADVARAKLLAMDLMSEIVDQSYREPDAAVLFGPEAGENHDPPRREDFDDVDDYAAWNQDRSLPPIERAGRRLSLGKGWRRTVAVDWVSESDLTQAVGSDQGIKRIVVDVYRHEQSLAQLTATITPYWQSPPQQ